MLAISELTFSKPKRKLQIHHGDVHRIFLELIRKVNVIALVLIERLEKVETKFCLFIYFDEAHVPRKDEDCERFVAESMESAVQYHRKGVEVKH